MSSPYLSTRVPISSMSDAAPGEVCTWTTRSCSAAVVKIRASCSAQSGSPGEPPSRKLVFSAATPSSATSASAWSLRAASVALGETHSPHLIRSSRWAASSARALRPKDASGSGTP